MARGPALILRLPCLALAQPLPETYLRAAEHFRVPPELLWAVTQTESGANLSGKHRPWPWTLNIKGTGYRYASREQACEALLAAIRRTSPKRIDVGLGQINIGWHRAILLLPATPCIPCKTCRLSRNCCVNATMNAPEAGLMPPPDITVPQAARPLHATVSWSVAICHRPHRHEPLRAGGAAATARGVLQHRHRQLWRINLPDASPTADADAVAGTPDGLRPDAAGHATRLAGLENRALSPQPAAPAALCADQQENPGQPPAAVSR